MAGSVPCAHPEGSFATGVLPYAVLPLLEEVASLPRDASGALIFGDVGHPVGSVLVEHGRICWAFRVGMRRRLTDILRHQQTPPLDADVLERLYRRCLELRAPLGETLVSEGVVTAAGLRSALRQHNAEALAQLAVGWPMSSCWVEHKKKRYDAQYTFSPTEILVSIGEINAPAESAAAKKYLQELLDETPGMAFRCSAEGALPIAQIGCENLEAGTVFGAGLLLKKAIVFSHELNEGSTHTILQSDAGTTVVWGSDIAYMAFCRHPSDTARLIGKLRRPR